METTVASNLCASTRPMARAPVGNTQRRTRHRRVTTVSSTSSFRRRRRRRRGRLLGRQAAGARPRHHIRCWLRRAMRCDGAFAAAPAQHARTQRHRSVLLLRARCIRPGALCVHGRARHGVRAHLLRSASASRREAKGARRSMANGDNVDSFDLVRDEDFKSDGIAASSQLSEFGLGLSLVAR